MDLVSICLLVTLSDNIETLFLLAAFFFRITFLPCLERRKSDQLEVGLSKVLPNVSRFLNKNTADICQSRVSCTALHAAIAKLLNFPN